MKDELILPEQPRLQDFQSYIKKMVALRGFEHETVPDVILLLIEELGEMAKAVRKSSGLKTDKNSKSPAVEDEIADVFIYLLDLANLLNFDLEAAFRAKEAKNKLRSWS